MVQNVKIVGENIYSDLEGVPFSVYLLSIWLPLQ